jgi:hypothetical protein
VRNNAEEYVADINQLYQYAHYSMLMPQLHRKIFAITQQGESAFSLSYATTELQQAEINDKIFSRLAQQTAFGNSNEAQRRLYFDTQIAKGDYEFTTYDEYLVAKAFEFHLKSAHRVEVLGDDVMRPHLGFSNSDFQHFTAALLAFSDHLITLGQAYYDAMEKATDEEAKNLLMVECIECTSCCMTYETLDTLQRLSQLSVAVFNAILPYFCLEYEKPSRPELFAKGIATDAYLPPFILTTNRIIFSPYALRYYYAFNNVLLSLKKSPLFDNHLSLHLEPVMIRQTIRLFAHFENIQTKANVHFPGSEMDLMVLSEKESVCLAFQMKATLAPSSTRTMNSVQTRSEEGIEQINLFSALDPATQHKVIEDAFQKKISPLRIIHVLMVRSSAGQEKIWSSGKNIVNYDFLCGLLGKKRKAANTSFENFQTEIQQYMEELIASSSVTTTEEVLQLNGLSIRFPDQQFNDADLIGINLRNAAAMGDFFTAC